MLISQFGSGTSQEAGVSIDLMRVTAVPEPSTWALSILTVGALGLLARRRKHQAKIARS